MNRRWKSITTAVLIAVFAVLVVQNLQSVNTKVLLWNFNMPRALLMILSAALGFAAGGVYATRRRSD